MIVYHIGGINQNSKATGPDQSIRALAAAQSKIIKKVVLISCFPVNNENLLDIDPSVTLGKGPQKKHYNPWYISKKDINRLFMKHGKPDIVNFHGLYSPYTSAFSIHCRRLRIPYVITPRGEITPHGQNQKKVKKIIANFLRFRAFVLNASALQALTKIEKKQMMQVFPINDIFVCPNGVSKELLEAHEKLTPKKLGGFITKNDLCVGYIGRIDIYQKGLDVLLEAFSLLKETKNSNIKLVVIGPFRTKHDESVFYQLVDKYSLNKKIKLLGAKYANEKLEYLLSFDLFIHTSRFEGMPMAILEAMAMKKPCLVTPSTNVEEMVIAGGGWKCKLDPENIANTLSKINDIQKVELKNRGNKSYDLVQSEYCWSDVAICNIDNYELILNNP